MLSHDFAKVAKIFPSGDRGKQRLGPRPHYSQHAKENEAAGAATTAAPLHHCHKHQHMSDKSVLTYQAKGAE